MAYSNMKKNREHAKKLRKLYSKKNIQSLTEEGRDNLYMMMFNRKLPKRRY